MTHGLATTGLIMMTTVPWLSVDSATWVNISIYGSVIVLMNGTMVYMGVTPDSSARHKQELHMDTLNPHAYDEFVSRLATIGLKPDHLRHDRNARLIFSMHEVQYWVDHHYVCKPIVAPTLWDL
jgi:hypothetical protein